MVLLVAAAPAQAQTGYPGERAWTGPLADATYAAADAYWTQQGRPMRTLQEWIGHRDISTTQRYADYAPSPHENEMIARAFGTVRAHDVGRAEERSER